MAQAILDLTWDTGVKARAMLLTDGTLEFNYRNGRSSDAGTISQCWEVDTAGVRLGLGPAVALGSLAGEEGRLRL